MNIYKISQAVIFITVGILAGVFISSKIHFLPLLIVNFQMIEEMVIKLKEWMDRQTVLVRVSSLYSR